jgi:hypothetical protein
VGVPGALGGPVDDVEVDVVGVGLPREDEAQGGSGGHAGAELFDGAGDLGLLGAVGGEPGGGEQAGVLAEDAVDAGEAAARVGLLDADADRGEGVGVAAGLGEGEGEEAVAGGVVGALLDGLREGVDGELEADVAEALEAAADVATEVGARGEEVDDRTVGAGGRDVVAGGLEGLAERAREARTG